MRLIAAMLCGLLTLTVFAPSQSQAQERKLLCVFDPIGASGYLYRMMQDYQRRAISSGVRLELTPYPDEDELVRDYLAGECDMAAVTDMGARKFNSFTGSISAIGAAPYYEDLRVLMQILASRRVAEYLVEDGHVFMGAVPMGAAYLFLDDKSINHVDALEGQRFAVFEGHHDARHMIEYLGGVVVESRISDFHQKFNTGEVDIAYGPASAYEVLEMHKGMGDTGGLLRYPVGQITLQVFAREGEFEDRFIRSSRRTMSFMYTDAMRYVRQYERAVPDDRWVEISDEDIKGYQEMLRSVRIDMQESKEESGMLAAAAYHDYMMTVLRKIRCYTNPGAAECSKANRE